MKHRSILISLSVLIALSLLLGACTTAAPHRSRCHRTCDHQILAHHE